MATENHIASDEERLEACRRRAHFFGFDVIELRSGQHPYRLLSEAEINLSGLESVLMDIRPGEGPALLREPESWEGPTHEDDEAHSEEGNILWEGLHAIEQTAESLERNADGMPTDQVIGIVRLIRREAATLRRAQEQREDRTRKRRLGAERAVLLNGEDDEAHRLRERAEALGYELVIDARTGAQFVVDGANLLFVHRHSDDDDLGEWLSNAERFGKRLASAPIPREELDNRP